MGAGTGPTVVIIDDHPAIIEGIQGWCSAANPPISVLDAGPRPAVAYTGPGSVADVVVFDLYYNGQPHWRDLRDLVTAKRRVIVYSQEERPDLVLQCIDMHIATYLTKVEGADHLVPAIEAVARDVSYTAPVLSGVLAGDRRPGRPELSQREREVLLAWFQCESKTLVARRFNLSPKTVDTFIGRVRMKYEAVGRPANSKAALVARALQDGLVELSEL